MCLGMTSLVGIQIFLIIFITKFWYTTKYFLIILSIKLWYTTKLFMILSPKTSDSFQINKAA